MKLIIFDYIIRLVGLIQLYKNGKHKHKMDYHMEFLFCFVCFDYRMLYIQQQVVVAI